MTHQWIPNRDDRTRPADLYIFVKRKPLTPGDDALFMVADELARVRRRPDGDWEWHAGDATGLAVDEHAAFRNAEDALRAAGTDF